MIRTYGQVAPCGRARHHVPCFFRMERQRAAAERTRRLPEFGSFESAFSGGKLPLVRYRADRDEYHLMAAARQRIPATQCPNNLSRWSPQQHSWLVEQMSAGNLIEALVVGSRGTKWRIYILIREELLESFPH